MLKFIVYFGESVIQNLATSKSRITIGRAEDNDLVLDDPHVSRLQAVIERNSDEIHIHDRSLNGILLDSQQVSGSMPLPQKCRLEIYPFHVDCRVLATDDTLPITLGTDEPAVDLNVTPSDRAVPAKPQTSHFKFLIGESASMRQVYQLIEDVSPSRATVLIRGEHGTGKELVARAIHDMSPRATAAFVPVNCAALPFDLIESELFGYEKGAFTGAQTAKTGKIGHANGGTIFLDEIGELSLGAQAKLLRFLQEKVITRLGSTEEISVDVRVVAATNRDLEQAVHDQAFRADLYYRLGVVQIPLPALRDRRDDIPLLVSHIISKLTQDIGLPHTPIVTAGAIGHLQSAPWPGNIRQLENTLYSAILRSRKTGVIDTIMLPEDPLHHMESSAPESPPPMASAEKELLVRVLTENQWDTNQVAKVLQVSRATVYNKIKKHGIAMPRNLPRPIA